ncbi:DUF4258 domain-containing protein [Aquabacterium sp.]|uniref:DUF4258 domain-containing protein n=1 Tax=Aquabacterium sp. TaxID=1872578 RepID=UPI0024880C58|nr:DUF4258 domain-containing protein [Aquabacterium sp.]MDI1350669.1 DUF4258 domain-containing protein [Aquabacterium sp.]
MSFKTKSRPQLQKHIRALAKDSANVFITVHASKRMKERKVISSEVYACLLAGSIRIAPEEDVKTGHLVCRMESYVAGRNLAACVALDDEDPTMLVVTVMVVG